MAASLVVEELYIWAHSIDNEKIAGQKYTGAKTKPQISPKPNDNFLLSMTPNYLYKVRFNDIQIKIICTVN